MISSDVVDSIKQQLKAKARTYYAQGEPDMADKIWTTYDVLETWEHQDMPGDLPIDLAEFGLELPIELTTNDEQAASRVAETVRRREQLRGQAREAKAEGRLATATDLWRQLSEIEPDDAEAQRELQQHAAALSDLSVRQMVNELRRKASSELFSDLDDALVLAQDLLTSKKLDDATQRAVQKLEEDARRRRADLMAACDEIETYAALGDLKEAISRLENFISSGRFEFCDRVGYIVSSSDKLLELNQEYASFCTQKTYEYLERAELSLPAFPRSAMAVLDEAWRKFERADPGARARLETRRIEVQWLIDRWDAGQALVARATKEQNPELRLGQFLEAKSQYDGLFNIDQLIAEAKLDAAGAVTNDVKNIHDTSRFHLRRGELDEARNEALKARVRAGDVRGNLPALETELGKIDQLMDDIADAAMQRYQLGAVARTVAFQLQNHDYSAAEQAIAQLPDEIRNLPQFAVLNEQIRYAQTADYQLARQLQTMLRSDQDSDEPGLELKSLARVVQAVLEFSAMIQARSADGNPSDNQE